jgi:hypothetical protein
VKTYINENATAGLLAVLPRLSGVLKSIRSPHLIDYGFQRMGIRLADEYFPIVRMPWVDQNLAHFLAGLSPIPGQQRTDLQALAKVLAIGGPTPVERVLHGFWRAATELRQRGIAPSDVHLDNLRLTDKLKPIHIDLDGCYVEGLDRPSIGETGLDGFRHRMRRPEEHSIRLADFPNFRVLHLLVTAWGDFGLFTKLFDLKAEVYLVSQEDIEDPDDSNAFDLLCKSSSEAVRELTVKLAEACSADFDDVPALANCVYVPRVRWNPPAPPDRPAVIATPPPAPPRAKTQRQSRPFFSLAGHAWLLTAFVVLLVLFAISRAMAALGLPVAF